MTNFQINDTEWASALQQDTDEYMMVLQDSIDEDADVDTLSGQPYCGCSDCYWREFFSFVAPKIMQAQLDGKIELA
jgi:hypothetical protein